MKDSEIFKQDVIKSISFSEEEIFQSIHLLHAPDWFELDPTYSTGSFYKKYAIPEPEYRMDIFPQREGVVQCSAETLPFEDGSIKSICFDPPFLADQRAPGNKDSIITKRFTSFKNIKELWEWYYLCLVEFKRVLEPGGYSLSNAKIQYQAASNGCLTSIL